ncbi:MAG: glycosyl transferase family protein [Acidobacteriota bacterium]|nr:glycosyl transferase family protein [Acidobacteriota bacterium]
MPRTLSVTESCFEVLDRCAVFCLAPIAVWILISGLDDLFITLAALFLRRPFPFPDPVRLSRTPERPIAIFVPLWHEHAVISRMLARNLACIRYRNYHVFAGVYPNDLPTLHAVQEQARRHPRIHPVVCPHPGPTSKGDCLNAIFAAMRDYETRRSLRFRIVVTHDAEDVIHPDSLRLINFFSRRYAMVQIPVLPLPTTPGELTHGLYCDEFAEYQRKDIPVRHALGGFLPSNGVGTGFDRAALDRLAASRGGRPFDPACLTEDYETGYRLHALGYSQVFVPLRHQPEGPVATREFFPRRLRASISQRTRWVTGISLQGWQHHGWPLAQAFWFWRDRKGLAGNLLSPLANLLFVYGGFRFAQGVNLAQSIDPSLAAICSLTCFIAAVQTAYRVHAAAALYGWRFAALVPVRVLWGNLVNCAATATALWEFFDSRRRGQRLRWRKTDHAYPLAEPAYASPGVPWAAAVSRHSQT